MTTKPKQAKDWLTQVRFDIEFAKRMLLKHGSVSPIFVIHSKQGTRAFLAAFTDDDEKQAMALYFKMSCVAENAIAISFISEAWARRVTKHHNETDSEFEVRSEAILPSKAEDRIEVILAEITWRDASGKHTLLEQREIERSADGEPSGVKPFGAVHEGEMPSTEMPEDYHSRWADLLPERAALPDEMAKAKEFLPLIAARYGFEMREVLGGG